MRTWCALFAPALWCFAESSDALTYTTYEECREAVRTESAARSQAWDEHARCYAANRCDNPGSNTRFRRWSEEIARLQDDCQRLGRQQAAVQQESRQNVERSASQAARESERLRNEAYAAQSARSAHRSTPFSVPTQRTSPSKTWGPTAAELLVNALTSQRPGDDDDDSEVHSAYRYREADSAKGQLQKRAFPGGSGQAATAIQDRSLFLLEGYQKRLEQELNQAVHSGLSSDTDRSLSPKPYVATNPWTSNRAPEGNPWSSEFAQAAPPCVIHRKGNKKTGSKPSKECAGASQD